MKLSTKTLFHVSDKDFDSFRKGTREQAGQAVFLTPDLAMVYYYAKNQGYLNRAILYEVKLNGNPDIFDPSDADDMTLFVNELKRDVMGFGKTQRFLSPGNRNLLDRLATILENMSKYHSWELMESPPVNKIIQSLEYDGYCVAENGSNNYAIYNSDLLKIVNKTPFEKVLAGIDEKTLSLWKRGLPKMPYNVPELVDRIIKKIRANYDDPTDEKMSSFLESKSLKNRHLSVLKEFSF